MIVIKFGDDPHCLWSYSNGLGNPIVCRPFRNCLGGWFKIHPWFHSSYPSIVTIVAIIASMGLLAYAMRDLPAGTAYAIWTGIGAVGTAIVGIIFLGESANIFRLLSLALIITGLIGLKVSS